MKSFPISIETRFRGKVILWKQMDQGEARLYCMIMFLAF